MRYGIFSDVHSNLEALEAVLDACRRESIDNYLCIGDVVGYAANPKECIGLVKETAAVTLAGNHDWAAVNLFSLDYFNLFAREAISWTRQNLDQASRHFLSSLKLVYKHADFTLTHATLNNPQEFNYMIDGYIAEETFSLLENKICFIGHTHTAGFFIKEGLRHVCYRQDDSLQIEGTNRYIVNVGSVGQPRDGNPAAAYCIYDTDKEKIQIKRVAYDTTTARGKIISVGLPPFLGERLSAGR